MRVTLLNKILLVLTLCLVPNTSQAQQQTWYTVKWSANAGTNIPLVRATLSDGKPWLFVVDTAMPNTLLDKTLVKELGLTVTTSKDPKDPFEYVMLPFHLGPDTLTVPEVPFVLANLSALRRVNPNVAGVLGTNFFFNYTVRLDYAKQQMDLAVGSVMGTPAADKDAIKLPLTQEDGLYNVEATLDGKTCRFVISTVADRSYVNSPVLLKSLKPRAVLEVFQRAMPPGAGSGAQAADTRLLRLRNLRLSTLTWDDPVFEQTVAVGRETSNGLGNDFLKRFNVVLDFPGSALYLTPKPSIKEDRKGWVGIGIIVAFEKGRVLVSGVYSPSPARAAGLLVGDAIVSVDGRVLKGMSPEEINGLFQSKTKLGATVTVQVVHAQASSAKTVKLQFKTLL
jgi:hypothetical protein